MNAYLQELTGSDITAKDFRTWGATLLAATNFDRYKEVAGEDFRKKMISETVIKVSLHLRNKPNTCKKYYIHPHIIQAFEKGLIISNIKKKVKKRVHKKIKGLNDYENKMLFLLKYMSGHA